MQATEAVTSPHRIYIKIRGQWRYLYRAIDKHGMPVDFLLTAQRDLDAAKRFFRKALKDEPLLAPDRIGTDGAGDPPPSEWSILKYGSYEPKEDCDVEEETQA